MKVAVHSTNQTHYHYYYFFFWQWLQSEMRFKKSNEMELLELAHK